KLVTNLETTGSLVTQFSGSRTLSEETIQDVKERLLASPCVMCSRIATYGLRFCLGPEAITDATLIKVFQNLGRRVQECLDVKGDHFQYQI
ncbi:hypothetical protein ANN_22746, partial [Periplaneta americana]